MALIVQKYGGTSVGSPERMAAVAERVSRFRQQGDEVIVVVSAMSGETDRLTELAHEVVEQPHAEHAKEMDVLLSSGEQVSIALVSMAIRKLGFDARSFLGGQVKIFTDASYTKARIQRIDQERLRAALAAEQVPVVAGFQGVTEDGEVTTFGRGGSDTTAVALAAALGADECQIYTDVDGVYTADPRIVKQARRLTTVTFEEMLELASLGSKVLHPRSVEFAGKYSVALRVLSSFEEGAGTLITIEDQVMEQPIVSGIAHSRDEAKLTVLGVPDIPGAASQILGPIGHADIEVDMIVQNIGADGTTDFTFTVKRSDFAQAQTILKPVVKELRAREVLGDDAIAKVSVVGVGMRSHAAVATRMFNALAKESINIQMISTSEIKISVVIAERYLELAVRSIHTAFELDRSSDEVGG